MAAWYVNAITGNDANSGASEALAKKTFSSVNSAASAGDIIYVSGVFNEALTNSKVLQWIGKGYAEINGNGSLAQGSASQPSGSRIIGITFRNFITGCLTWNGSILVENCIFADAPLGVYESVNGSPLRLNRCQFYNCSIAAIQVAGAASINAENCVFVGNARSFYRSAGSSANNVLRRCVMRDAIMVESVTSGVPLALDSDFNSMDFSFGKCRVNAVDYTTIAGWRTFLGSSREASSIDQVPDVGDLGNFAGRSTPGSALLTQAPGGTPIGLPDPAVTLSDNENSALWTGGVFSNTEIDGNGYIVLSAGQTEGYWRSDVIDFGAALPAQRVEIVTSGESYPSAFVDYDTGDSPGHINIRVRGSNSSFAKGDGSPSWTTVPRNAEIGAYMSNHLRYWQVEITLREP